jgi:hypothetical protein
MMRFLSPDETKEWLMSFNVSVSHDATLRFPESCNTATQTILVNLPDRPLKLTYLLERVVDWLPRGRERLLMMSHWNTFPPHPLVFFETARQGCGERRHVIDAPGLLIESDDGPKCQEFSESPNTATFVGFALLVVNFDWRAYLISKNETSHIYLGDEFISFSTADNNKAAEAFELARRFDLKLRGSK